MGTDLIWKRGSAALNNCGFVSTKDLNKDPIQPFLFMMDMSMLGVGVGADTKGADKVTVYHPVSASKEDVYVVEDTREGWVDAIKTVLEAYLKKQPMPTSFDTSKIRPAGTPLKTMGGVAPGPQPLIEGIKEIKQLLNQKIGQKLDSETIVDVFNLVGKCVVSGGIRRTAQIMFGEKEDEKYLDLKNPEINSEKLMSHRWASNNSVFAQVGDDYTTIAERTARNGEPGYIWLDNIKTYGRLKDNPDFKDIEAEGTNPCGEQTLHNYELCCLVETYPPHHDNVNDYYKTLELAHEYAKTVTLIPTHFELTNNVMMKNRRMGVSMSGITQAITKFGRKNFFEQFCDIGYMFLKEDDVRLSKEFSVPESIKLTSVKPSGTVSLLSGATPGIHYPQSKHYIRRIRFDINSPYWKELEEKGYHVEDSAYGDNTKVVSFPVKEKHFDRSVDEVSIWEQMKNVADMQYYWADNQVSATINFKQEEANQIEKTLKAYETQMKSISFLPLSTHGYKQAPYETITEEEYQKLKDKIKNIQIKASKHEQTEMYCDGESCTI